MISYFINGFSVKMLTLFLLAIFCGITPVKSFAQDSAEFAKNPLYIQETGLYDIYKTKKADIVFFGDSHIKGADWNELLGREKVVGRGITSDVLEGYLSRLHYIYKLEPKICFITGGLNDIYGWIPVDKVFQYYTRIIRELRTKGIIVVVQSTLYTTKEWANAENRNPEVEKLNKLLKEYCNQEKIEFIDLNAKMSNGIYIKNSLVNSWGHLNPRGYKIWAEEVEKVLYKLDF